MRLTHNHRIQFGYQFCFLKINGPQSLQSKRAPSWTTGPHQILRNYQTTLDPIAFIFSGGSLFLAAAQTQTQKQHTLLLIVFSSLNSVKIRNPRRSHFPHSFSGTTKMRFLSSHFSFSPFLLLRFTVY